MRLLRPGVPLVRRHLCSGFVTLDTDLRAIPRPDSGMSRLDPGAVVQCDECTRTWVAVYEGTNLATGEAIITFRAETRRQRRRRLRA